MITDMKRIWRVVALALMIPGLAVWIYSGIMWNHYLYNLPRVPDQTTGRIYPRNIHGIVIFQTRAEQLSLDITQGVSIGLFFVGLLIGAVEDRHWKRTGGRNSPPMPEKWQPK